MASANPYLNFAGNCTEAFDFYKSVLGGEFDNVMRFSDLPSDPSQPLPDEVQQMIAHVSLPYGDSIIMGSDVPAQFGTVTSGSSQYVCLGPDDVEEGRRLFEALSDGGEIEMAYDKQPWGDYYGSATDRFGIKWMVDVGDPQDQQPG